MEEATGEDVVITQPEAHELQKAKAAMYTGTFILMRSLGIIKDEISKVFVAGGFDTYIDPASLRSMGVLSDFPLVNVKQVGNAAGTGARTVLFLRMLGNQREEYREWCVT